MPHTTTLIKVGVCGRSKEAVCCDAYVRKGATRGWRQCDCYEDFCPTCTVCGCGEDVARALAIDDSEYGPEHREVAITLTIHRKECLHAGSCNLFLFTCHIFSCATDASRCINGWSMSICLTCFSLARSAHHLPWGPPKITNSQVHYHIPIEHYKTRGSVRKRFSERTLPHNKTACFFAFHNIPTLQNTYLKKHSKQALIHIQNRSLLIKSLLFTRFQSSHC